MGQRPCCSLNPAGTKYPSGQKAARGDVTLRILVRLEGLVTDARIIRSSGNSQLDNAALISAGYWNYLPAIKGGTAIDSWKTVTVHFVPKDSVSESFAKAPILPEAPYADDNGVLQGQPNTPKN